MGPELFFNEEANRFGWKYGIFPKYVEYFDSKEEAESHFDEIWDKHVNACNGFKYCAILLASYAVRRVI